MALLKRSTPASPADDDGRMSLMDHIRELRNRLVKIILGIVVGTIVGFIFFDPIWDFMTGPFCRLPAAYRLGNGTECNLVVGSVTGGIFINLKVAFMFGLVAAAPIWLYQLWAFVTPGLYRNERRYSYTFLGIAVPLFLAGSALAYLTMDKGLSLLLGFVPDNAVALIDVSDYLSFLMLMLVIFGVSFLLPLLMAFLNIIGVLRYSAVAKHQRMVVFLMFVFAAIATPSQDPFTMLALGLPMIALFYLALAFMYFRDRKQDALDAQRARELEEELDGPSPSVPAGD
ncbi:Sec-independent protein translocase protein TatC [Acrocarpospora phusangensis]|uniref:Sec-independent protein translocase protein TatC n=1 Tax=Acrocarpospora phusangensis TaxID=1070424 RepID=A0A919QHD9_9ACTN|nr:twin-arginine translocase subunit TatC [Acrocarpospora phusangensis]GIH29114.1 Sec-independent protein translocase protein TatC [Acrocarpospora phusangensis]